MSTLRVSRLVLVAALVFVPSYLGLDLLERNGSAPLPVPVSSPIIFAVLSALVLVTSLRVRRWVRDGRAGTMSALTAARIAVLAMASAYLGAAFLGWYAAQAAVILPDLVGQRQERFVLAVISSATALVLMICGSIGQRWCRLPDGDDPQDPSGGTGS